MVLVSARCFLNIKLFKALLKMLFVECVSLKNFDVECVSSKNFDERALFFFVASASQIRFDRLTSPLFV